MIITDQLIIHRENFLNRILNVDPERSLNLDPCSSKPENVKGSMANDIKGTLNRIKSLAFSPDGTHVNYQELASDPLYKSFGDLICELREFDYQDLSGTDQQLSFWINLYNALVIHGVIQNNIKNSVIESRLGILGFFYRNTYTIKGQRFSLTDIEHGVLRANRGVPHIPGIHFASNDPRMKAVLAEVDPRIHFALNCASQSCPPIGVYSPDMIQDQLDLAASNYINTDLQVFPDEYAITVSRIFQWYQTDFGGKKKLIELLAKYLADQETRHWLVDNHSSITIKYQSYDWKLNSHQL